MTNWFAIAHGALDVRGHSISAGGHDLIVVPAKPAEPLFLREDGSALWLRLTGGGIDENELTPSEREIIRDMESMGIAVCDASHPARIRALAEPWLISPTHELVYALLARIADEHDIRICFIKGPTLHAQGLRERVHSGDVDCWVEPGSEVRFARAAQAWGWRPAVSAFTSTQVLHSLTLRANGWGCAIDVHSWFPGMSSAPSDAFETVYGSSESRTFAGVAVRTPSVQLHAVINGLNEIRPSRGRVPSERQLRTASTALHAVGEEAIGAAISVGAEYALAEPLSLAFPEHGLDFSDATPPKDWAWRNERTALRAYIAALKVVPPSKRARVLFRILWPTKESLLTGPLSNRATDSPGVHTLRVRRLLEGARQLLRGEARVVSECN